MASAEDEVKYRQSLSEEDHDRYRRISGAWIGLGIEGCDTCEFAKEVNKLLKPIEPLWGKYPRVSKTTHYAIEMNGLKRESSAVDDPLLHREDRFNENKLFITMTNVGMPEEEFDVVCGAFKKCIDCDSALKTVGRNRTFEETKAILESE